MQNWARWSLLAALLLGACGKDSNEPGADETSGGEGKLKQAGKDMDEAADEAGEKVEDAADDVGDKVDEATE